MMDQENENSAFIINFIKIDYISRNSFRLLHKIITIWAHLLQNEYVATFSEIKVKVIRMIGLSFDT